MVHKQNSDNNNLTRRQVLKYGAYTTLAGGLSTCLWVSGCSRKKAGEKPNIIFILIDTIRADHLPSCGYQINTAPNLERLISEGVLFKKVIAQSSWTKTSMASVVTSTNPSRHGVRTVTDVLPSQQLTTIAQALSNNGYRTIAVNTNPWLKPMFGFRTGYYLYKTLPFTGNFAGAWNVNKEALELLKNRPKNEPVFLYLHYMDVHAPYRPKPPFFSKPPLDVPGHGQIPNDQLESMYRKQNLDAPGVQQRVIELYDGEIKTTDAAVNQLLKELKKAGGFDNTLVVITSDHGEAFREHGTTEHGWNLYPEVYEVPLIFHWPKYLPAGIKIDAQVRLIDIAPTLFALTDSPIPESFDGKPLLPMKPGAIQDRLALSAVGLNDYIPNLDYRAVVSPEFLYVRERINNKVEFYDLQSDPLAINNLGSSHPKASLFAKLEETDTTTRKTEQTELDQQTRDQLKSLGYLH